jgi:Rrf2 family iron-sulfur cluster assembly transcriptional regulator
MQLGTKGRYAVIALLRLHDALKLQQVVPLSHISEAENISITYLEQLFTKLRKAGVVNSVRGQSGGYVLAREAAFINVAEIIMAAEENILFTRCGASEHAGCTKTGTQCKTHNLWEELTSHVYGFLSSITLEDLALGKIPKTVMSAWAQHKQAAND